ncbi:hypothetical protein CONPUDRAFT_146541 [Coniophora puteana RWD-64-598 SS2]|uniref:Uncharacterized protein n=1 Tax=Coniophora puteana (strain RWD-64-598) TaxID=741705 RepID=A0A5M3ME05_CONPW|nr:uncharacterized protein CONPUDRAFT_146541 [Coniophora puteana RWD-64-598 SS2]EIW76811.1 hypothetical protein CONPUDRAFT_146541 [Coniophora puteana RWD-64-598 SS2]
MLNPTAKDLFGLPPSETMFMGINESAEDLVFLRVSAGVFSIALIAEPQGVRVGLMVLSAFFLVIGLCYSVRIYRKIQRDNMPIFVDRMTPDLQTMIAVGWVDKPVVVVGKYKWSRPQLDFISAFAVMMPLEVEM